MRLHNVWLIRWLSVIWLSGAGCGDDGGTDADAGVTDDAGVITGAATVFEPAESGPVEFLDVPFPSDLYLDDGGHVAIGEMLGYPDYIRNGREELSRRTAFCRICTVAFPVSGALDPASVPGDAGPDESASLDDPVVLMRADGEGEPVPLQVDYHEVDDLLVIKPRYGIALDPGVRYVAAVTADIQAADGSPLRPAPMFEAIRDGGDLSAAAERARPMVEDALAALQAAGVTRERVVTATIFTTEGDIRLLRELGDVADAAPVPSITVERVWTEAELDDLFGQPSEDRPGIDIPPAAGAGTRSVVHDAIAFVVKGTFESPRVVTGNGTDIGLMLRDDAGVLTAGPTPEQIPWVLVVPKDVDLASVPVVLAHHGNPSNKRFALRVGNAFARDGMAVFGYDAFQMGGRAPSSKDEISVLREEPPESGMEPEVGPDGLEEHADMDVLLRQTGLAGAAPDNDEDPGHAVAFSAQISLDVMMAVRLLRESDLTPVNGADAALADLSFDADQIYYIGQSYGGYMGMVVLPLLAGRVQAAVLMVGPPDFAENTCNGPINRPLTVTLAESVLRLRGPFDEVGRRLSMTPIFDLARWALEPFSPAHTLHFALKDPVLEAEPPDILLYYAEYDEYLGNGSGEHVLGIAGVPATGPTYYTTLPALDFPLGASFETPSGAITAGGIIWESDHNVIRVKNSTVEYEAPFMPPFEELPEPRDHVNPIEDAHAVALHFFQTRRATGRAEIADPDTL